MRWLHFKWAINLVQGHVLACKMHDYCFKGYSLIEMNFLSHVLVNTQLPYNEHLGIFFNQIIKILSGLIEIQYA